MSNSQSDPTLRYISPVLPVIVATVGVSLVEVGLVASCYQHGLERGTRLSCIRMVIAYYKERMEMENGFLSLSANDDSELVGAQLVHSPYRIV